MPKQSRRLNMHTINKRNVRVEIKDYLVASGVDSLDPSTIIWCREVLSSNQAESTLMRENQKETFILKIMEVPVTSTESSKFLKSKDAVSLFLRQFSKCELDPYNKIDGDPTNTLKLS